MFWLETAFGGKVSSRKMDRQVNELTVQCWVLIRMIQVAKLDSYAYSSDADSHLDSLLG